MGDRVSCRLVSGDDQQNEERSEFLIGELFAVDVCVHKRGGQVVGGVPTAELSERSDELMEIAAGREQGFDDLHRVFLCHVFGVARSKNDVGPAEDGVVVAFADSHHVAYDLQREPCRHVGHEISRAFFEDLAHDLPGGTGDVVFDLLQHPRCECACHDLTHAGVAWIVHVDHRPEEVVHELGHVGNRRGPLAGTEQFGLAAHI